MTLVDRTLADCVHQMEHASSLEEINAGFADTLKAISIDHYNYQVIRVAQSVGRLPYVLSNYPEAWLQQYASEGYLDDDPIIGEATRRKMPFLWTEIAKQDELSLRQRTLLDRASGFGITRGISVPLSGNGAACAVVSFAVQDSSAEADKRFNDQVHLLHLLAIYLHNRACQLLIGVSARTSPTRRQEALTVREREVLGWAAKGKSACEIALIMVISKKSVDFSVEAAKRKLHVFNRTHAVVKALELGLISANA